MRYDILNKREEIISYIEKNLSKAEICRRIGCRQSTLNSYLTKLEIEYSGNMSGKGTDKNKSLKKPASYYLSNNMNITSHKLRLKLIEEGIKEHKCEICLLDTWLGDPIPIELHHIDGNRFNNNFENLQILCPNCHSRTGNYSGKSSLNRKYLI